MHKLKSRNLISRKGAEMLRMLSSFVVCRHCPVRGHQDFVRTLIQASEQTALRELLDDSRWRSDHSSTVLNSKNEYALETQAAFLCLLSDLCDGKSPASFLYVERLVPWNWLLQTCTWLASLPLPAAPDEASQEKLELVCARQRALLTFMRKVYMGINGQRLCSLLSSSTYDKLKADVQKVLFPAFVSQIRAFCHSIESWPQQCVKTFSHCLTQAVFPLMHDYYTVSSNFTSGQRALHFPANQNVQHATVAQDIWEVLHSFVFPTSEFFFQAAVLMTYLTTPEMTELKSNAIDVMNILVLSAGVPRERVRDKRLEHAKQNSGTNADAQLSGCVQAGFESFRSGIVAKLREIENDKSLPLRLPLFLSAEDAVISDISPSDAKEGGKEKEKEKDDSKQCGNPTLPSLLVECLPILNTDTTDEETMLHVLSLLRGAMYLSDPRNQDVKVMEAESFLEEVKQYVDNEIKELSNSSAGASLQTRWELCEGLFSVLRAQDGDRALLTWVQNKFDRIGCTQVALRLCSHDSVAVQVDDRDS